MTQAIDPCRTRLRLVRSRWAAIGAAVAVTLGAGGLGIARAASGAPASLVTIEPVRVLDTRVPFGLGGALVAGESRLLDVTGTIPVAVGDMQVGNADPVPDGASGIVANVTVVAPTSAGWVAVRPGDASGVPTTSSLNITSAGVVIPNAVTVGIPTSGPNAGTVDLYFHGDPGATTHLLVDIVGYYLTGTGGGGVQGPPGPAGPPGPPGPPGPAGAGGDVYTQVIVVKGGQGSELNGQLLRETIETTRGSLQGRVLIFVEPGSFDLGAEPIVLADFVSLVGSGRGVTSVFLETQNGLEVGRRATIADLTIENVMIATGTPSKVLTLSRAHNAVLRDIEVVSGADSGISILSSSEVLLDGVDVNTGDRGILVTRSSALTPPSTVTVIGSTVTSERSAIWGLDAEELVTIRESTLVAEDDTINAYQGGRVVIEHSRITATVGAWAAISPTISVDPVYEVVQSHIVTQQPFDWAALNTPPMCVGITTPSGSIDTCP